MIRQYFYCYASVYAVGLTYCLISEKLKHQKLTQQIKDNSSKIDLK